MPATGSVFFSDRTLEVLGQTASRSGRIGQIADRYGMLIARAQRDLLDTLTTDEIAAIKEAFAGFKTKGVSAVELLEASVNRVTTHAMASLNASVINKIRAMDDLHKIAIVDWIEQQHI